MGLLHILGGVLIFSIVTAIMVIFFTLQIMSAKSWACFQEDKLRKRKQPQVPSHRMNQYRRINGL